MKKAMKIAIIVGAIFLLIVIGIIIYFTVFTNKIISSPSSTEHSSTEPSNTEPSNTKYYFCPGHPEIDKKCMSCAGVGASWSKPYDTIEECQNDKRKSKQTGVCVGIDKDVDCKNSEDFPKFDMELRFKTGPEGDS